MKTITKFVAEDGTEFSTEDECLTHERKPQMLLMLNNIDFSPFVFTTDTGYEAVGLEYVPELIYTFRKEILEALR